MTMTIADKGSETMTVTTMMPPVTMMVAVVTFAPSFDSQRVLTLWYALVTWRLRRWNAGDDIGEMELVFSAGAE